MKHGTHASPCNRLGNAVSLARQAFIHVRPAVASGAKRSSQKTGRVRSALYHAARRAAAKRGDV